MGVSKLLMIAEGGSLSRAKSLTLRNFASDGRRRTFAVARSVFVRWTQSGY